MEGQATELRDTHIEFTGSGHEYFGIWIVNILLTIITLGIYSAWARVRTRKYFYNNTRIDGALFDYHANPVTILKGWVIVLLLIATQQFLIRTYYFYGYVLLLVMLAFVPWAMVRSRVFNLLNTSYRNVRFHFDRDYKGLYAIFLIAPLFVLVGYAFFIYMLIGFTLQHVEPSGGMIAFTVLMILLGIFLLPYFMYRLYRFIVVHSSYGSTYFKSSMSAGRFYVIYLQAFGLFLVLLIFIFGLALLLGIALSATGHSGAMEHAGKGAAGGQTLTRVTSVIFVLGFYFIRFFVQAKILNEAWGKASIAGHRFSSKLSSMGYAGVVLSNLLLIILTIGFYIPWAKVRLIRYRLDSIVLQVDGSLDNFAAQEVENIGATGMEFGEAMDFVISL